MADLSYSIDVNTRGAVSSIDALKTSLNGLTSVLAGAFAVDKLVQVAAKFESLRVSLGILYKDTATGAQAFDRIKNLAATSVFSVEDLTNSFIKLKSSGIEPTDDQLRLFADVSSVAADSVGALQAITDLFARTTAGGLGLEDLNRLADRGIPVFNILSRTMGLSRLEVAKFGQSAEGAQKILKVLEQELGKTFGGASAARANTLAQAMANVSDSFQNLIDRVSQAGPGNALTDLLKSLSDFLNGINVQQINIIVENIKNLVIAFASLFAIGKIAGVFETVTRAMGKAAASGQTLTQIFRTKTGVIASAVTGLAYLKQAFDISGAASVASYTGGNKFVIMLKDLASGLVRIIPFVGNLVAGFYALDSALTLLTGRDLKGWFDETAFSLEKFVTDNIPALAAGLNRLGEMLGMAPPPSVVRENQAEIDRLKKRADAAKTLGQATQEQTKPLVEQNAALDRLRITYAMLGIEAGRYTQELRNRMGFDAGIIGMSEDQVELETKLREEAERYQRRLTELQDKQIQLQGSMIGEKDTKKLQEYQLEIELITKLLQDTSDAHLRNRDEIIKGVNAIQSARLAEQDRKNTLEGITREMERQAEIQGKLRDIILEAQDRLQEEQYRRTRPQGLAGQIADIQRTNRKAAEDAARSFSELFNLEDLSSEDAERFRNGLDRIASAYGKITEIQIEQLEYSRTWSAGWDEAFTKFKENSLNAADEARNYFETFTRGFESAIVRFVQTGKLSFKDLFKTLAAEIIKMQTNKLMANFLGASGIGSMFGGNFLKSLFGGGGETAGSAVLGLPGFARGGYLPSGQMGIVGENGPELITGPASITPIQQSQPSQVIYQIQAVDASSFRALVARDPQFIYNITEQGRRSQPTRRLS